MLNKSKIDIKWAYYNQKYSRLALLLPSEGFLYNHNYEKLC